MLKVIELVKDNERWELPECSTITELEEEHEEWKFGRTNFRYVLTDGNNLIGYISNIEIYYDDYGVQPNMNVIGVYILEKYRGKGYGKVLLEKALKLCEKHKRHHLQRFTLTVRKDNIPALKLYKSCGFIISRDDWCYNMVQLNGMSLEEWKSCGWIKNN